MTPVMVHSEAMALFPTNPHQRMIHYGRHATYDAQARNRNPRMVVPDFIGTHGEGKTAIAADYVLKVLGINSTTHSKEELNAALVSHLTVVRGGGITDFADIVGLQYIDPKTKQTKLARQESFGSSDNISPWRLVLIDDWTRALPHTMQGLMHILNEGRFNGFSMDPGAFIVATRNPEGDMYNVTGVDPAQYSRTIPFIYNVSEKTFFEQLAAQKIDPEIQNFWMKHSELARPTQIKSQPQKEANCSRFRMLFSQIYEYIKYDQAVLNEVASSMFGPEFLAQLMSSLRAHQPIPPEDILANYTDAIKNKLAEYAKGRQDVLTVTIQRLAYYLNDSDTKVTDKQIHNLVSCMVDLPQDSSFMLCKLLCDEGQPRSNEYINKLASISKQFPADKNIVKRIVDLRMAINKKLN